MSSLAPEGAVYQAGTLSGNPLATAAGLAALDLLEAAAYERLYAGAARLGDGLQGVFDAAGVTAQVPRVGSLLGVYFGSELPADYDAAKSTDEDAYARFFHAMLARGVAMAPGAYEALFVGLAHTDEIIDEVVAVAAEAVREI